MRLSITECGAVADGKTLCTDAINKAIETVAQAGGGYVTVPAGEYVSGTIFLKSNVYLWLEPGSTIFGSMDINDFSKATLRHKLYSFVIGEELENCGILGEGTLDLRRRGIGYTKEHGRPCLIMLICCKKISLRGVTLQNTGFFTIYSINNTDATFDSLVIDSEDCENGDGIDFSGSRNVTISNCKIKTGDDAIGLKTHFPDEPCENFTITNCVLSSRWAGIRLGPETCGDMLNITVSNCVFNDCSDGLKLQLCDSFRMEDLTFSNLNMANVKRPIFMTSNSCPMSGKCASRRPTPGSYKRVLINNVIANIIQTPHDWFENQLVICGLPDGIIEDVMISNLHVIAAGGGREDDGTGVELPEFIEHASGYPDVLYRYPKFPSACMYIKNAARVKLFNCVFEATHPDARPAVVAEAVDGLKVTQAEIRNCAALLRHYRVEGLSVTGSDGAVVPLSPEYAARWDAFRAMSLAAEEKIIANARVLDIIRKSEVAQEFVMESEESDEYECTCRYDGGKVYLHLLRLDGSPKVSVGGREIYSWERSAPYAGSTPVALELTDALAPGENKISIRIEGGCFKNKKIQLRVPTEE